MLQVLDALLNVRS